MKWYVWVLNSWLVFLFVACIGLNTFLKQKPPRFKKKTQFTESVKKKAVVALNLEKIFQNDLFDTFKVREIQPTKRNLVTPIPEIQTSTFAPPPAVVEPTLLPALNVTLKGIILSSDDMKSVAMIADAANKEGVYHVGAQIQDAQIIKIAQNRAVLLRSNGQQEILYLRKDDNLLAKSSDERWKQVVNKIDEVTFEVDPAEFKKEITSLGEFIETLRLSTSFSSGQAMGVKVGNLDPNDIGPVIGLAKNDIITAINNVDTKEMRNRLNIYDSISQMTVGQSFDVNLRRNNRDMKITYKLKKLETPLKKMFTGGGVGPSPITGQAEKGLPQSDAQKQEEKIRTFQKTHPSNHEKTIQDLRRRLLENMKLRTSNMRVR